MYYGEEKSRQMARSLLPSTRRRAAKWRKRVAAQKLTNAARAAVVRLRLDEEDEHALTLLAEGECHRQAELRSAVRDRRDADKIAPFLRWAKAKTAVLPQESRLAAARGFLPDGLIGQHALDHLVVDAHFEDPAETEARLERGVQRGKMPSAAERRALLEERLRTIVEDSDAHRALNLALRRAHQPSLWDMKVVGPATARQLGGLGDIPAFLDDLTRAVLQAKPSEMCLVRKVRPCAQSIRYSNAGEWPPGTPTFVEEAYEPRPDPNYHPEWIAALEAFLEG